LCRTCDGAKPYLEVNPAFEQLSGLENVVGKTAVELNPIVESFWLEAIDRVVQTGVATRLEEYAEGLNRWIDIYFSRVGGEGSRQIAVVFNDITDQALVAREGRGQKAEGQFLLLPC
jgi:PAS domain-containing protein